MTETPEPTETPAVEDMTLDDLRDHMRRYHYLGYGWSKFSKAKLLEYHQHQHADYDFTVALERDEEPNAVTPDGKHKLHYDRMVHRHGVAVKNVKATVSQEDLREVADAAKNGAPLPKLSSAERSALKQLVDNDFTQLKTQMQQLAQETKDGRLRATEAEWADKVKEARRYEAQVQAKLAAAARTIQLLREEAAEVGITLELPRVESLSTPRAVVTGLREARQNVVAEVDRELSQALLSVERQRLAIQRRILLAGVSGEAASFLKELPTAQEALLAAAQEQAERKELTTG